MVMHRRPPIETYQHVRIVSQRLNGVCLGHKPARGCNAFICNSRGHCRPAMVALQKLVTANRQTAGQILFP